MTNLEIVANEVINNQLMTKEQVQEMLGTIGRLPYMTYQEWLHIGYQVKKGSKAVIKTKLWKPVKSKQVEENSDDVQVINNKKFILVNASLFDNTQVEKVA